MTDVLTSHDVEEGGVPNGWSTERIADVLTELPNGKVLNQGKSPQCEKEPSPSDEVWGVLKTTAIQPGEFLSVHNKRLPSSREPDESIEVASGDLLLTCAGPRVRCGVPCLVRETRPRLMLSGKMYRFRPDEELISAEFLEGYLLSPGAQELIERMKTGTSDSGLNLTHGRFSELPVPVPPVSEQGRIVEILDEQLSRLDTALESVHTVREKAAQFRRSLLHAAFTGALTGHDVEQGELPEGWRLASLKQHVRSKSGSSKIIKGKQASQPGDGLVQGFSASGPDIWVEEVGYDEAGVAVSAVGARCGKTFLAEPPWTAIANTHALVPDDEINVRFLWHLTNREDWWIKSGTAQPFVKVKDTLERPTLIPSLPEQGRIVEILEDQLSRLDASLAVADAVEERSAALRRSLLHSAFTGRLTRKWREAVNV